MKEKWQQLSDQEQRILLYVSPFVLIFLLYLLVWQPLNDSIATKKIKLVRQQALLTWVKENSQRYASAQKNGKSTSKGSVSSIVNRTAKQMQVKLSRIQPQGDSVQIWVDEIPFNTLLVWLERLSTQEGLNVENIDLSTTDTQGVVQVRRLRLGRA